MALLSRALPTKHQLEDIAEEDQIKKKTNMQVAEYRKAVPQFAGIPLKQIHMMILDWKAKEEDYQLSIDVSKGHWEKAIKRQEKIAKAPEKYLVNGVDDDPDDMEGLQYEYEQCYSKWATHIYQKTPLYDALALVVQQIIDGTTRNRLESDIKILEDFLTSSKTILDVGAWNLWLGDLILPEWDCKLTKTRARKGLVFLRKLRKRMDAEPVIANSFVYKLCLWELEYLQEEYRKQYRVLLAQGESSKDARDLLTYKAFAVTKANWKITRDKKLWQKRVCYYQCL